MTPEEFKKTLETSINLVIIPLKNEIYEDMKNNCKQLPYTLSTTFNKKIGDNFENLKESLAKDGWLLKKEGGDRPTSITTFVISEKSLSYDYYNK